MTKPHSRLKPTTLAFIRAISNADDEAVQTLLEHGVDPNGFWVSGSQFPLAKAGEEWGRPSATEDQKKRLDRIIRLLMARGADPFAQETVNLQNHYCIASHGLRQHPAVIEAVLPRVREWAQKQPEKGKELSYLLGQLGGAGPLDIALLDALRERPSTHTPEGIQCWWKEALQEKSGTLMDYVLDRFEAQDAPSPKWIREYLTQGNSLQSGNGLLAWLKRRPDEEQTTLMLGEPGESGEGHLGFMTLILNRISSVGERVWRHALGQPRIIEDIKQRNLLPGMLVLSMKADPKQAERLLNIALKEGVDVGSIVMEDVKSMDPQQTAWESNWPDGDVKHTPKPQASLVEVHLRRNDQELSISLVRKLIKAGAKPDFGALQALCLKMTHSTKDRLYTRLFDEWTQEHGVDPAPEGESPAWSHIPEAFPGRIRAREALERRWHQYRMDRELPDVESTARVVRPRL